jgi:RAQPRD family integrative conjugative element protein
MKKFVMFLAIGLGFANVVSADVATENETLARVVQILNSLKPLINEAELQHDEGERIGFDYHGLRADLENVKAGIAHKFDQTLLEPRIIQPIKGDYLIVRNQSKRSV